MKRRTDWVHRTGATGLTECGVNSEFMVQQCYVLTLLTCDLFCDLILLMKIEINSLSSNPIIPVLPKQS